MPGIKENIHKKIQAGEKIPFTVLIYKPFFKNKLPFEIESYIKKTGGDIIYIKSSKELKSVIGKLKS